MNPASKPAHFCLSLASIAMICGAGVLWSGKLRHAAEYKAVVDRSPLEKQEGGTSLLARTFSADNRLSYSAVSRTEAFVGGKKLISTAQVTRAPRHLSIKMLSGPMSGVKSGYSDRWFWRQEAEQGMKPYAEVKHDANEMAARRFALLSKNYQATRVDVETMDGRSTDVVELWPQKPVDGAKGPARRLYIDRETGLTLRVDAYNCDLMPVMRSTLSKLNLRPSVGEDTFEQPAAILASLKKSRSEWRGEEMGDDFKAVAQKTGFMPPRPAYLPPGFVLESYGVHRCRTTGTLQLAAFSRYCDGLNSLMVFSFKPVNPNIEKTMRGICDFGPGAMSSREDGEGRLVAMGDLPRVTLERVLAAAKFETAH